ncbi:MAG: YdcH family protein [Pseudomonadota bacterium]
MSHVPHDLPEMLELSAADLNTRLEGDQHLARLAERYRELNREIHRAETDVEPTSDDHLHEMKKERLSLLDTLRHGLVEASA